MTFAYLTILILMFVNWGCAFAAKKVAGFALSDNRDPRGFLGNTTGKAARLNAAQQNGHEIFAPFAAAVIIAHITGQASQGAINFWAMLFIVSRGAFVWCYAQDKPTLRSLAWGVGMMCIVALFIVAI